MNAELKKELLIKLSEFYVGLSHDEQVELFTSHRNMLCEVRITQAINLETDAKRMIDAAKNTYEGNAIINGFINKVEPMPEQKPSINASIDPKFGVSSY